MELQKYHMPTKSNSLSLLPSPLLTLLLNRCDDDCLGKDIQTVTCENTELYNAQSTALLVCFRNSVVRTTPGSQMHNDT